MSLSGESVKVSGWRVSGVTFWNTVGVGGVLRCPDCTMSIVRPTRERGDISS